MSMTKYGISDDAVQAFKDGPTAKKAQALPDPATLQDRLVDGAVSDLVRSKGAKTITHVNVREAGSVDQNVSRRS